MAVTGLYLKQWARKLKNLVILKLFSIFFGKGKPPLSHGALEVLLSRALCAVLLASGGCVSFAFDLFPYQVRCGATEGEHNYKDSKDGVQ